MQVSVKVLEDRVRRALALDGEMLHKNPKGHLKLGEYYITDENNFVIASNCIIDELAEDLAVLRTGETIE
ncbi:hypothetical protein [Nitrosococcus wardiae]|uniref:Uncharacterized protein n=1 Tax=Nitrosococcus wardiae TaxID=1814290 RepID=A0A4P7C3N5_9GAMM|nr:hypothetical protein [Nitrosococcus wardiae]QBQ56204.1 hypothetical protein E3U44_18125 [Nitrosococcus wardiae]